MKKLIVILLVVCTIICLSGCVSQDELDVVIAERDTLQTQLDAAQVTIHKYADLIGAMDAEDYPAAMDIISQKQIAKEIEEKGEIDKYLVTVELTTENFDEYFAWNNFYALNDFGEQLKHEYRSVLTSKAYDQGLILYACDVKLGYTQTVNGAYFGHEEIHSSNGTCVWSEKTMPTCGSGSAEGVEFNLEKCQVEITRVEGTVTFVKEDYVASYVFDGSVSEIAEITLVNGETLYHQIAFGCKY